MALDGFSADDAAESPESEAELMRQRANASALRALLNDRIREKEKSMPDQAGHTPAEETASAYAKEPEWLPRLRADMAKEIAEDPDMKRLTTWLGWPEKAQQVRTRAAEVAVALAASYLHEKQAEIRDLVDEVSGLRKAMSRAETTIADRDRDADDAIEQQREIARLRAELKKAHHYIGVQALAALGIEAPEDDRG